MVFVVVGIDVAAAAVVVAAVEVAQPPPLQTPSSRVLGS